MACSDSRTANCGADVNGEFDPEDAPHADGAVGPNGASHQLTSRLVTTRPMPVPSSAVASFRAG